MLGQTTLQAVCGVIGHGTCRSGMEMLLKWQPLSKSCSAGGIRPHTRCVSKSYQ